MERLLRRGPHTAAQLMAHLGVSQPTLSRAMHRVALSVTFRLTGDRTPWYALLRSLPLGLAPRQRIHRVLSNGSIEPFATVEFLCGGATIERAGPITRMYAGLPPYMMFAAPSGFLGRQFAQHAAKAHAGLPESLKDWNDDHRVAYLFTARHEPGWQPGVRRHPIADGGRPAAKFAGADLRAARALRRDGRRAARGILWLQRRRRAAEVLVDGGGRWARHRQVRQKRKPHGGAASTRTLGAEGLGRSRRTRVFD
ncbi:MAG: ArsR family transcriptional regulator [Acidovorax sp.]|nr:ArsR family transcriptional regulator [Acidovorax sp.]